MAATKTKRTGGKAKAAEVQSYGSWGVTRQQIDEGIIKLLASGPQPRKALTEKYGGEGSSPARVMNAIKRLLRDKRISRCSEGYKLVTAKPKRAKQETT